MAITDGTDLKAAELNKYSSWPTRKLVYEKSCIVQISSGIPSFALLTPPLDGFASVQETGSATGVYDVTFTSPYTQQPTIQLTLQRAASGAVTPVAYAVQALYLSPVGDNLAKVRFCIMDMAGVIATGVSDVNVHIRACGI